MLEEQMKHELDGMSVTIPGIDEIRRRGKKVVRRRRAQRAGLAVAVPAAAVLGVLLLVRVFTSEDQPPQPAGANPHSPRITFSYVQPSGKVDLVAVDPDGENQELLAPELPQAAAPAWSPDGKRIVFLAEVRSRLTEGLGSAYGELAIMNADGSDPLVLRTLRGSTSNPRWIDDDHLLYVADDHTIGFRVIDADGTDDHAVEIPGLETDPVQPAVSTDGRWVTYWDDGGIGVISIDGSEQGWIVPPGSDLEGGSMFWSPDGRRLAYGAWDHVGMVDVGSGYTWTIPVPLTFESITWSPDGSRFAMLASNGPDGAGLYTIDISGIDLQLVTRIPNVDHLEDPVSVSWRPVRPESVPSLAPIRPQATPPPVEAPSTADHPLEAPPLPLAEGGLRDPYIPGSVLMEGPFELEGAPGGHSDGLFALDLATGAVTAVVNEEGATARNGVYSEDGRMLAYTLWETDRYGRDVGASGKVVVAKADGTHPVVVYDGLSWRDGEDQYDHDSHRLAWLPDGRLAFIGSIDTPRYPFSRRIVLAIEPGTGTAPEILVKDPDSEHVSLSGDGNHFLFSSGCASGCWCPGQPCSPVIFRSDLYGTDRQQLTVEQGGLDKHLFPISSPDGHWVLWTKKPFFYGDSDLDEDLWVVRSDGTDMQPVIQNVGPDASPLWTPDGSTIVYTNSFADGDSAQELYAYDLATGRSTALSQLGPGFGRVTDWVPRT